MEYYSTIKRNETELFVVRWIDLESDLPYLFHTASLGSLHCHFALIHPASKCKSWRSGGQWPNCF